MYETYSDFCPVSNSEETIEVDYIPYSSLGSMKTYYRKGRYSYSNPNCFNEDCPLYNSAPNGF